MNFQEFYMEESIPLIHGGQSIRIPVKKIIKEDDEDLPEAMKKLLQKGREIAEKIGVMFNGWMEGYKHIPGAFTFTDMKTKSTFLAKDEKEAIEKLKNMRLAFARAGK